VRQRSEPFDQDSGYALAVDPLGLAGPVRPEGSPARSPLVDGGSRDLWNDGYTASRVPPGYPQQDNPSTGDNPALAYESNSEDVMDIGYHYLGTMRPPSITVACQQEDYWSLGGDLVLTPEPTAFGESTVVVSRSLDGTDDRLGETTLYTLAQEYLYQSPSVYASPVMALDFEESPDVVPVTLNGAEGIIDRDRTCPFGYNVGDNQDSGILHIAATAVVDAASRTVPAGGTDNQGVTYLATVMHWDDGGAPTFEEIYIWRSTNGIDFDLIGTRLHVNTNPHGHRCRPRREQR